MSDLGIFYPTIPSGTKVKEISWSNASWDDIISNGNISPDLVEPLEKIENNCGCIFLTVSIAGKSYRLPGMYEETDMADPSRGKCIRFSLYEESVSTTWFYRCGGFAMWYESGVANVTKRIMEIDSNSDATDVTSTAIPSGYKFTLEVYTWDETE